MRGDRAGLPAVHGGHDIIAGRRENLGGKPPHDWLVVDDEHARSAGSCHCESRVRRMDGRWLPE
jgi:hypothetical protein